MQLNKRVIYGRRYYHRKTGVTKSHKMILPPAVALGATEVILPPGVVVVAEPHACI